MLVFEKRYGIIIKLQFRLDRKVRGINIMAREAVRGGLR